MPRETLWVLVLWAAVIAVGWRAYADPRDIANGTTIYKHGYCDQPYVVVTDDGTWVCVFTTSPGEEGNTTQYVVCTRSMDQGKTWSEPMPIESPDGPQASWAMPLLTRFGRVYAFYSYNGDNVTTLPDGKKIRSDTLGWYCYRYSDDLGVTWSERYRLPMRVTACDRGNDFAGKVQMFWGIGKPVIHGDTVWFAFTKLARYFLEGGEGWFYRSDNVLTERDVSKVTWELLPDGDHGLRHPDFGSVQEEQNVVPLSNGDLYCMYRTTMGHPVEAYSRDGGHTWTLPQIARYANGNPMKTPRACPRIWRAKNGKFLFWYHNHGGKDFKGRNPAWLSGGVEIDGRIAWSQPEIVLYGSDHSYESGRFSYPDLIEQDGRYWITTTQKVQATVHEIDPSLLEGLWNQAQLSEVAQDGLVLSLDAPKAQDVPMPNLPDLKGGGFTIDMRFRLPWPQREEAGQVILDSRDESGRGIQVYTASERTIGVTFSDGEREAKWASDRGALGVREINHVTIIVDGGPDIITFVVDGTLCDGGTWRECGWGRFDSQMGDVTGSSTLRVAESFKGTLESLRVYSRPLRTSEAIGNWRNAAAIMPPGRYSYAETAMHTGEEWWGLYPIEDGFEFLPAPGVVEVTPEPYSLDESNTQGREYATLDSREPLVFVRGLKNPQAGPVETVFSGRRFLHPGEELWARELGKIGLFGAGTVECVQEDGQVFPKITDYSVNIWRCFPRRVLRTQELLHLDRASSRWEDSPRVLWVGDLDRDGKMDLLMNLDPYPGNLFALFLSSEAREGDILREVARFKALGC